MTYEREVLIKSKTRVQNHGEVFTPKWMVEKMLDMPGIKEVCESIESTFLEPSAGEGAFLIVVLTRKLEIVSEQYNGSMKEYEHYSLFVLTTLYGIELLQDNVKICVMNMFEVYQRYYNMACKRHKRKQGKSSVLNSAKTIISANIQQGDFLTRRNSVGEPIIFNEWKVLNNLAKSKSIKVIRTEYTLEEIQNQTIKPLGEIVKKTNISSPVQLDLFSVFIEGEEETLKYSPCIITDVYKKIMED